MKVTFLQEKRRRSAGRKASFAQAGKPALRRQESQLCAGAFLFCRKSEFLNSRKGQKG